jgi:hypothetical protein
LTPSSFNIFYLTKENLIFFQKLFLRNSHLKKSFVKSSIFDFFIFFFSFRLHKTLFFKYFRCLSFISLSLSSDFNFLIDDLSSCSRKEMFILRLSGTFVDRNTSFISQYAPHAPTQMIICVIRDIWIFFSTQNVLKPDFFILSLFC